MYIVNAQHNLSFQIIKSVSKEFLFARSTWEGMRTIRILLYNKCFGTVRSLLAYWRGIVLF